MPVRTACLALYTGTAPAGFRPLVECPPDRTLLIKDATVQLLAGPDVQASLVVRRGTSYGPVQDWLPARYGRIEVMAGRNVVLEPGDWLEVWIGGSASIGLRVGVWGARLAGVAPA